MKTQLADSLTMAALAEELSEALSQGTVRQVVPLGAAAAVLEVAGAHGLQGLLLNWQAGLARVHLVEEAEPSREETAFIATLRRLLRGAQVLAVRQQAFDRVIELELINVRALGPDSRARLILEATGRQANCVVVGEEARILAVARPTPRREGLWRELATGATYHPPPGQDKLDPRVASPQELQQALAGADAPLERALRKAVQGLSPVLLAEISERSGLDFHLAPAEQPEDWPARWAAAMGELVREAAAREAWLYRDKEGRPALVYPTRLRHLEDKAPETVEDLSAGLALVGRRLEEEQEFRRLREAVLREVKGKLARARRAADKRARELAAAEDAEQWRRWGELLLASLDKVRDAQPGSQVQVPDYYAEGTPLVTIPLLPGKDARHTADEYFKRHRRAQRTLEQLPAHLAEARDRVARLEKLAKRAEEASELAELEDLAAHLGLEKRRPSARKHRAVGEKVEQTTAPSGHVVLFGRSALENDALLRRARPSDLWLHARGVKGAHVLIRTDGKPEAVPRETIVWAARLAGRMSDYRPDGVADVDYTLARYVRKPRGSPPGFVTYTHQKTLRVALGKR
ncbi:MAG: NFACT family protein [Armatimonadetes bacterium]|nr:NFACT family protein [Armatimonadota bacterium]